MISDKERAWDSHLETIINIMTILLYFQIKSVQKTVKNIQHILDTLTTLKSNSSVPSCCIQSPTLTPSNDLTIDVP